MCTKNLSLLFAPSLFQTDGKGEHEVKIVEDLIDNYLYVFDVSTALRGFSTQSSLCQKNWRDSVKFWSCFRLMRSIRLRSSWRSASSPPGRTLRFTTVMSCLCLLTENVLLVHNDPVFIVRGCTCFTLNDVIFDESDQKTTVRRVKHHTNTWF